MWFWMSFLIQIDDNHSNGFEATYRIDVEPSEDNVSLKWSNQILFPPWCRLGWVVIGFRGLFIREIQQALPVFGCLVSLPNPFLQVDRGVWNREGDTARIDIFNWGDHVVIFRHWKVTFGTSNKGIREEEEHLETTKCIQMLGSMLVFKDFDKYIYIYIFIWYSSSFCQISGDTRHLGGVRNCEWRDWEACQR